MSNGEEASIEESKATSQSPDSADSPTPSLPVHDNLHDAGTLYLGSLISEDTGILMLKGLAYKHGITEAGMSDILRVVQFHMPENSTPASYRSRYCLFSGSNAAKQYKIVHSLCGSCITSARAFQQASGDREYYL